MNTTASPVVVAPPAIATPTPKTITLTHAERRDVQLCLDQHIYTLTSAIDNAVEEDDYAETKRLAGLVIKAAESLLVLTK